MRGSLSENFIGRKKRIGVTCILLGIYCLPILYLFINTILSSFKTRGDLAQSFFSFPTSFTLENYEFIIVQDQFMRGIGNSVLLTFLSLLGLIVVSSMLAYGISWYQFKGKNLLEIFFLFGMMFPIQLGILPNFIMLRNLGLINKLAGLILLYVANLSLSYFIFAKSFKTLPKELYEAAVIDGAGEFKIFFRIMLPISRPVIGTVALVSGVNIWNDFYMPMVFLTKDNMRTITLSLYRYTSHFMANWDKIFPAITLVMVPIVILFLFTSSQMISGLTAGAVKK